MFYVLINFYVSLLLDHGLVFKFKKILLALKGYDIPVYLMIETVIEYLYIYVCDPILSTYSHIV